jgi:hypothetical protein
LDLNWGWILNGALDLNWGWILNGG